MEIINNMSIYDEYYEAVNSDLASQRDIVNLFYRSTGALERFVKDTIDRFLTPSEIHDHYSLSEGQSIEFKIDNIISGLPELFNDLWVSCTKHSNEQYQFLDISVYDSNNTIYYIRLFQQFGNIGFDKVEMESADDPTYNRIKHIAFISLREYINKYARR